MDPEFKLTSILGQVVGRVGGALIIGGIHPLAGAQILEDTGKNFIQNVSRGVKAMQGEYREKLKKPHVEVSPPRPPVDIEEEILSS